MWMLTKSLCHERGISDPSDKAAKREIEHLRRRHIITFLPWWRHCKESSRLYPRPGTCSGRGPQWWWCCWPTAPWWRSWCPSYSSCPSGPSLSVQRWCYFVFWSNEIISKNLTSFLNCQLCFWLSVVSAWRSVTAQCYPVPSYATKKYLKSLTRVLPPLTTGPGHQH